MKDKWLDKEEMRIYKREWKKSHQRILSRKPNGKTIYHKCLREGCNKMVKQTASQKRYGGGLYCSKQHIHPSKWRNRTT